MGVNKKRKGQFMQKLGMKWFPFPTFNDNILQSFILKYNHKGIASLIAIYQRLFGLEGYYLDYNEDVARLVAREACVTEGVVSEIVNHLVGKGYFDKTQFEEHHILTSTYVQTEFLKSVNRRLSNIIGSLKKDYILEDFVYIFKKNVYKNEENVYKNEEIVNENKGQDTTGQDTDNNNLVEVINTTFVNEFKELLPQILIDRPTVSHSLNMFLIENKDKLFNEIKNSNLLSTAKNWTFQTYLNNMDKILNGFFRDFNKKQSSISTSNTSSRKYTEDEIKSLFTNLDEVEIDKEINNDNR